jgi:endonuclease/exonuclease/phosphatase family metal-dependent hydrolase
MRVATFNVRHCEGLDGLVDVDRVAAAIRATQAELIALQELDRGLPRSGAVDQPAALAAAIGLEVVFHPTLRRGDGEYGIALAGAAPLDVTFVRLPRIGDEEPRGLQRSSYNGVTVIATHLSRDRTAREAQLEAIAAEASGSEPPVLILGDLNDTTAALERFGDTGFTWCEGTPTLPAHRPRRQIDHVLAGSGLSLERCWTIPTDASDHRPLVADVLVG